MEYLNKHLILSIFTGDEKEMARTAQPSWVKHILKLLGQAKAKDPDLARFGAYSHQYKLAAPAGEEAIQEFEKQQGIRLPEEYRDFLMLVGNGGAGPYYGTLRSESAEGGSF